MDRDKKYQLILGAFLVVLILYMSSMAYGLYNGSIETEDPKNYSTTSTLPMETTPEGASTTAPETIPETTPESVTDTETTD